MSGRVVLITGASGGLGSVVTPMFLDAGYRVAAVAVDWPEAILPSGSMLTMTADLSDPVQAEQAVRKTLAHYGRLDCLAHLVGYFGPESPIEETSDATWTRTIDVNLRAAFHMMRASIRPMRDAGGGRMVMIGSTVVCQPVVMWAAFSAAMGGLKALVEVAAAELRDDRITVNLLNPSTIDTPAVRAGFGDKEAGRWVDPEGLGSLMLWLCSEAGRDVSGASIAIPARQRHPSYEWPL
jgi:NAD(P)-dependent dehydrogenase (short-subunit alcohol dehydrogenase family)